MRWVVCGVDEAVVGKLAGEVECPLPVARLLVSRKITAAREFFAPTLDDLLDPFGLLGMAAAVARIEAAVQAGEPILIYGDYDVDGTVATVLLKTAIERIASPERPARVSYHVPHRIREGYGMQGARLGEAAADGVRLVISVDTGIRAFRAAEEAKALGLDLIVTDHHLPDGVTGVPEAVAVVNPAQAGCGYKNKSLCGAGVAFKLAHALLQAAAVTAVQRDKLERVLLPSFLKLVAIATIADSVALTGENRAMVWLGLRELRNPVQPGLRALLEVAKLPLDRSPTAVEVGFRIAPRINAAGRMDVASDVVELFLARDVSMARGLAEKLDRLNTDRRATELKALQAIEMQLAGLRGEDGEYPAECLIFDHPEWHRGVLGILASRVVDRTGRPALVLTEEDGQSHGSGRSIDGFHLLDALTAVHGSSTEDAVFTRFGGHAHAVGFSLPKARLAALRKKMQSYAAGAMTQEMLAPARGCDLEVTFEDLTPELLEWVERCAPFGMGHPEPVFLTRGLVVVGTPRVIQEEHVCLPLTKDGAGRTVNGMGWSRSGGVNWIERTAGLEAGSRVDVVYRLCENKHPRYGGLELQLVDLETCAALSMAGLPCLGEKQATASTDADSLQE